MESTVQGTRVPTSTTTTSHPTVCPPWCKHREEPTSHAFGPTATWHFSRQFLLPTVAPTVEGEDTMMRVELVREDEGNEVGTVRMSAVGESEGDLDPAVVDVWLAKLTAFTEAVQALRSQMDAS